MDAATSTRSPGFRALMSSDIARYVENTDRLWVRALTRCLSRPGIIASLLVRAQSIAFERGHRRTAAALRGIALMLVGIDVSPGAVVGAGLWLEHPVGIVIGNGVKIGDRAVIAQGVTMGVRHSEVDAAARYPTVGDDVTVGANAVILGGITIGDGAVVGANAVVLTDIPPRGLAVGVPARVIDQGDRNRQPPSPAKHDV